jgi:hypothetical protein
VIFTLALYALVCYNSEYRLEQKENIRKNDMQVYSPKQARDMILNGNAPRNMVVDGHLNLENIPTLTELINSLEVHGDLSLEGSAKLKKLPDGLEVELWLNLRGCKSLTELPKDLTVGHSLILWGCKALTALPADLNVGGCIFLNHLLYIPDTVICESFEFRGVKKFPRELINDPSLITDEMIEAEEDEYVQEVLTKLMKGHQFS